MIRIVLLLFSLFTVCKTTEAQITAIPVVPEPLTGFMRAPLKTARIGNRLFATFQNQTQTLFYSDNEGASWATASTVPDFISDVVALDNQLFVFVITGQNDTRIFTVKRSTDLGFTFTDVYSFQETKVTTNGDYTNLCSLGKIMVVNGVLFLNYYSSNKTGTTYSYYYRCKFTTDGGNNWQTINAGLNNRGPAENIVFGNGHYVLVSGAISNSIANGLRVYASTSPDFSGYWELPFVTNTHSTLASGFSNGKLILVGNAGRIYQRDNFDPLQKFTTSQVNIQPWEAGFYNDHLYFLTFRSIYRSPAIDPTNIVKVFSNFSGQSFTAFTTHFESSGSKIFLFSDEPLRSDDNGLTWQSWPVFTNQQWAGDIYAFGDNLFLNNSWGRKADPAQNFKFWDPQGLPEDEIIYWHDVVEHKGLLFLMAPDPDINTGLTDWTLFKSADNGANWTKVKAFPDLDFNKIYSNANRLYIVGNVPGFQNQINYTNDAGLSWGTFANEVQTYPYAFASTGDTAYILNSNRFYATYDGGQNWQFTQLSTLAYPDDCILLYHGNPVVAHGHSKVIEASNDGGQSFFQTAVLPGNSGFYYTFRQIDSLLFAMPENGGTTYVTKGQGLKWVSFSHPQNWSRMKSVAIHNGYLYGSQQNYYYTYPTEAPFSRIPIDQILDPLNNLGTQAGIVKGAIFYDNNPNCVQNAGEPALNGQIITFNPGGYSTAANPNGAYGIALPPGSYTVALDTPDYHVLNCINPPSFSLANGQSVTKNAGFRPAGQVQDLRVMLGSTRLRPGMPVHFYINVKNAGTIASPAGLTLYFYYPDDKLTFNSADPTSAQLMGEVRFLLPSILPYTEQTFRVNLTLAPDPGLLGQILPFSALIPNTFNDVAPTNNSSTVQVAVGGSFDPNDKKPITNVPDGSRMGLREKEIEYRIRFQNTGNDTAFHIVVRDTLSSKFLAAGIKTLSTSHPYRFVLREGRIAEWHFDPIALPDSTTDEAGSHGYIHFSIPVQPNLAPGDLLTNSAAIYFDFNHPVITNTAITKMVRRIIWRDDNTVSATESGVELTPNPVTSTGRFRIIDPSPTPVKYMLLITDTNGKQVDQVQFTGTQYDWERGNIPNGVYFWQIIKEGETIGQGRVLVMSYKL